jgi:hypothetical protein
MATSLTKLTKPYYIELWEYERGWGAKVDSYEEFDTEDEAKVRRDEFNKDNNLPQVPDWYMVAKGPFENVSKQSR